MEIKVLGSGCTKCGKLEAITREAVGRLGLDATVEHVTDMAQIMADILRRRVVTVAEPQNCGAAGAAYSAAIGLGWLPGFDAVRGLVPLSGEYSPDPAKADAYERNYAVFKRLYGRNRGLFAALNAPREGARS